MSEKPGGIFLAKIRTFRSYVKGVMRRLNDVDILFLSSGIAFNGILCLIPLLLLLTSILGVVLHSGRFPTQKIDDVLNAIFPLQPYAQKIKTGIKDILFDVVHYRRAIGISATVVLVWTSTSLFSAVRTVLKRVYKVGVPKPFLRHVFENLALLVLLGVLFLIANTFTWILAFVDSILQDVPLFKPIYLTGVMKFVSFLFSFAPALLMFFIINRFLPPGGISGKAAFIASLTTTSLWWMAGRAFGWYLTVFHPYNKLYGTYAFLLVFILWIYYSSVVFVLGAVAGQLYRERHAIRAGS